MPLSVRERGDHVATFRWIDVRFMEMLAAWVPTTPEMEVKLVLGAHIWDVAQHADALGRRTQELRLPLHHGLEPSRGYVELLSELASTPETGNRIAGFYDCLLPGQDRRFRDYLGRIDVLLDAPTVRILERIMTDVTRMIAESRALRDEVPAVKLADGKWLEDLRERESGLGDVIVPRSPEPAPTG